MQTKTCSKCGVEKPLSEYCKNSINKTDGHRPECKKCKSLQRKGYYQSNLDTIKEEVKKYRKSHKEVYQEYCKKNKNLLAMKNRHWTQNNPDKRRAIDRKRRERKQELDCDYTREDEEYTMTLFNHQCALCSSKNNLQIDHHYPLSEGHGLTKTNAVVLCADCNRKKWKTMPESFYSPETLKIIEEKLGRNSVLDSLASDFAHTV